MHHFTLCRIIIWSYISVGGQIFMVAANCSQFFYSLYANESLSIILILLINFFSLDHS